ncbi:hypothetical protein GPECTOR_30g140 [Gonium pectorale]|uniref:6-phosphofructo-2-kinase domain-containing protein n=1 Tax=Gonium pectorale TaxID=33097 RepID=A0A150GEQ1_GONPE|nr:hypothetical protein GPECTOR_30g140 [Gonium pectorale]|eukprot:KXZ48045.1 hypothetical protein GPECTOR_30g140 [Gonium pectorale]
MATASETVPAHAAAADATPELTPIDSPPGPPQLTMSSDGPLSPLSPLHRLALADPPLGRRSAPIVAAAAASPVAPPGPSPADAIAAAMIRAGSTGGAPGPVCASSTVSGSTASGGAPRTHSPAGPLSMSSEYSRRLRGLVASAVNFRDVELVPARASMVPGELDGVLDLDMDHGEDTDADAATGSAAPLPALLAAGGSSGVGASGAFAGSGGGVASGPNGRVYRLGSAGSIGSRGSGGGGGGAGGSGGVDAETPGAVRLRASQVVRKNKLVIIMVGLPGRGKTFLCNKICCYLNWLGHPTRHFNVGQYRRRQKAEDVVQDAEFLRPLQRGVRWGGW